MNPKLHRNLWASVGAVSFVLISGWLLVGCAKTGFQKGYDDSVKVYNGGEVRQGYCQGYLKGWNAYILERGRADRWKKQKPILK